jgi:hypothetical protein
MKIFNYLLFAVCVISCQGPEKNNEKDLGDLKEEVMEVHDAVMPKMGEMRKIRIALSNLADSLASVDSVRSVQIMTKAKEVADASEAMMVWMRQYEPSKEGTEEELENYFLEQKKEIQKVSDEMISALESGKALLENQ